MAVILKDFKDLADVVLYHRKKSGLSRLELARMASIGKTAVYDVEQGKPTVRLDTLLKILSILNIKIELTSPLMHSYRERENEKR